VLGMLGVFKIFVCAHWPLRLLADPSLR
jgi:hypothetical protein